MSVCIADEGAAPLECWEGLNDENWEGYCIYSARVSWSLSRERVKTKHTRSSTSLLGYPFKVRLSTLVSIFCLHNNQLTCELLLATVEKFTEYHLPHAICNAYYPLVKGWPFHILHFNIRGSTIGIHSIIHTFATAFAINLEGWYRKDDTVNILQCVKTGFGTWTSVKTTTSGSMRWRRWL